MVLRDSLQVFIPIVCFLLGDCFVEAVCVDLVFVWVSWSLDLTLSFPLLACEKQVILPPPHH